MGYSTESHGIPPLQLFTQTRAFEIPASMTRSIRISITAARTPAVDGPGPTRHPAFCSPRLLPSTARVKPGITRPNLLLILGFTAAYSAANARFQQRLAQSIHDGCA